LSKSPFTVTGVKSIDKAFKKFGKEMKKILRKNMRKGMKDLHGKIRSDFPKDTGETAKGIKVRVSREKKRGEIAIDVRSDDDNYIAKWIEFGTQNEDQSVRIEAQAPFRKGYDEHGETAKKITIDGTDKDAKALLRQMKKEGK